MSKRGPLHPDITYRFCSGVWRTPNFRDNVAYNRERRDSWCEYISFYVCPSSTRRKWRSKSRASFSHWVWLLTVCPTVRARADTAEVRADTAEARADTAEARADTAVVRASVAAKATSPDLTTQDSAAKIAKEDSEDRDGLAKAATAKADSAREVRAKVGSAREDTTRVATEDTKAATKNMVIRNEA